MTTGCGRVEATEAAAVHDEELLHRGTEGA